MLRQNLRQRRYFFARQPRKNGGRSWIRTSEGVSQQIYSLPPLATWVSYRPCFSRLSLERQEPQISMECAVVQHFTEVKAAENLHERWAERKWKDENSMNGISTFAENSQII